MGLFIFFGIFKVGVVLCFVMDWVYYNYFYILNIFNIFVQDSIVYCKSFLIYYVEGLQDNLFILYGMIDDNVQFQDVVCLV